ncbi:MAG: hypothetical protein P4K93_16245 [Terracidiphilus sp.]|nr:hypothetical protein [Terracidiphilus sp.]
MEAPHAVPAVSVSQAEEFFTTGTQAYPAENLECSCGGIDVPGVGRTHAPDCDYYLRVLIRLRNLYCAALDKRIAEIDAVVHDVEVRHAAKLQFNSIQKEAAQEGEESRAGDGIRPSGAFGEPWHLVCVDPEHQAATIATGSGIGRQYYDLTGTLPNLIAAAHRVIECVNFCAGVPSEYLRSYSALALCSIAKREGLQVVVSREGGAQ